MLFVVGNSSVVVIYSTFYSIDSHYIFWRLLQVPTQISEVFSITDWQKESKLQLNRSLSSCQWPMKLLADTTVPRILDDGCYTG